MQDTNNQDNTSEIFHTMCAHFGDISHEAADILDIKALVLQTIAWARAGTDEFPSDQCDILYKTYLPGTKFSGVNN